MLRLVPLLLGVASATYSVDVDGYSGDPECPCIDSFQYNATHALPPGNETSCDWRAEAAGSPCYSASYGNAGCRRYDLTASLSYCGVDNPPSWCGRSWCWVDPTACYRPKGPSGFFPSTTISTAAGTRPLTYSYATCGNLDQYGESYQLAELRRFAPLRVTFPGDSGSGYTIVGKKLEAAGQSLDGVKGTGRDGSVLRFFDTAMAVNGIAWQQVELSASSLAFSPKSSFTACVHEVALNRTDVCVGNIWPTAERRLLAAFTSVVYQDAFCAIAFRRGVSSRGPTVIDALYAPLAPFAMPLWASIIGMVLFVALAMWIVEGWSNTADFPDADFRSSCVRSSCAALLTFPGGNGANFAPQTRVGQFIVLVFSVCSLVLTAQYTAVVTSNLIRADQKIDAEIKSFDDALALRVQICGLEATRSAFSDRYPDSIGLYSGYTNSIEVLVAMDEGLCSVGILTEDEWHLARMGLKSQRDQHAIYANATSPLTYHCDTKIALEAIYFVGNAFAASDTLQAPLSWALTGQEDATPYSTFRNDARNRFLKTPDQRSQPFCNLAGVMTNRTARDSASGVELDEFFGPILWTVFGTAFALLASGVIECMRQYGLRNANDVDVLHAPPSLYQRLTGRGRRTVAARSLTRKAESRMSGDTSREDEEAKENVQILSTLLYGRDRFKRALGGQSGHYRETNPDAPLQLSDVPMLLQLMRKNLGDADQPAHWKDAIKLNLARARFKSRFHRARANRVGGTAAEDSRSALKVGGRSLTARALPWPVSPARKQAQQQQQQLQQDGDGQGAATYDA